tara:strand:- start:565 stop:759 length:195 start_codon:yes stop_codon:yes gene_type:complete
MGLLASVVAITSLPLKEDDGGDEALGDVFNIRLMEMVNPQTWRKRTKTAFFIRPLAFTSQQWTH